MFWVVGVLGDGVAGVEGIDGIWMGICCVGDGVGQQGGMDELVVLSFVGFK